VTFAEVKRLHAWAAWEQELLWNDLAEDLRRAINSSWSIGAANTSVRIIGVAQLIGPTPYGSVPWRLLASGIYAALLSAGGVPYELPSEEEWESLEELMCPEHGQPREVLVPRYRSTVRRIFSDSEIAATIDTDTPDTPDTEE